MPVDTSDELSYEYLTLLIQEFEDAALKANTRAAYLAVANGNTFSIDLVLDAQEKSLRRVETTRQHLAPRTKTTRSDGSQPEADNRFEVDSGKLTTPEVDISEDIDLNTLFGQQGKSPFASYLEDCLGCNLRLKFDFQLKPIAFLAPINQFTSQIDQSLDMFEQRIDPLGAFSDICDVMNQLTAAKICPQDIIILLMSMKMLMKKYTLDLFSIKLDWTTLVGPLLHGIVGGISDLLDNVFSLLMAPLDCTLGTLKAGDALIKAGVDVGNTAGKTGKEIGNFFSSIATGENQGPGSLNVSVSELLKQVSVTNPGKSTSTLGLQTPTLTTRTLTGEQAETTDRGSAVRFPSGFVFTGQDLSAAMNDPKFSSASFLQKMIVPLHTVIKWLSETYHNFMNSLTSLTSLVGGGFSLNLSNLGTILFILDLISVLMMIIELMKEKKNVGDWCEYIGNNPQVLEQKLRDRFGDIALSRGVVNPESSDIELVISRGPDTLGVIKACLNKRSSADNIAIQQWVKDLEARGFR